MARFGVTLTYPNLPVAPDVAYSPALRYGQIDLAVSKSRGYDRYVPPEKRQGDLDKKILSKWHPSDREYQIVFGKTADGSPADPSIVDRDGEPIPDRGCSGNLAEQQISDVELDLNTPERAGGEAWDRTEADSRALAVEKEWSECMADHGYTFAHRWDPPALFDSTVPPTQREIKMATADVECAQKVNYVGVWNGVEREYEERSIAEHETEIREYQAALQTWRDQARQLIAEG